MTANTGQLQPVMVGVDGSGPSEEALAWASAEAALQGRPLRVATVWMQPVSTVPPIGNTVSLLRNSAENILREAVARARNAAPDIEVDGSVLHGATVHALVKASKDAALLVVGSRGHGGFASMLLGSTSDGVARHTRVPVVVVRGPAVPTGPVVVGVDESEGTQRALGFAFEAAQRRGVGLVALHGRLEQAALAASADRSPTLRARIEEAAHALLTEALSGWAQKYPDVEVTQLIVPQHPVPALSEAGITASLLVVGSRGFGGFAELLLGSVGMGVLHHATCPVAVVPA